MLARGSAYAKSGFNNCEKRFKTLIAKGEDAFNADELDAIFTDADNNVAEIRSWDPLHLALEHNNIKAFNAVKTKYCTEIPAEELMLTKDKNGRILLAPYLQYHVTHIDATEPQIACTLHINENTLEQIHSAIRESGAEKQLHNWKKLAGELFAKINIKYKDNDKENPRPIIEKFSEVFLYRYAKQLSEKNNLDPDDIENHLYWLDTYNNWNLHDPKIISKFVHTCLRNNNLHAITRLYQKTVLFFPTTWSSEYGKYLSTMFVQNQLVSALIAKQYPSSCADHLIKIYRTIPVSAKYAKREFFFEPDGKGKLAANYATGEDRQKLIAYMLAEGPHFVNLEYLIQNFKNPDDIITIYTQYVGHWLKPEETVPEKIMSNLPDDFALRIRREYVKVKNLPIILSHDDTAFIEQLNTYAQENHKEETPTQMYAYFDGLIEEQRPNLDKLLLQAVQLGCHDNVICYLLGKPSINLSAQYAGFDALEHALLNVLHRPTIVAFKTLDRVVAHCYQNNLDVSTMINFSGLKNIAQVTKYKTIKDYIKDKHENTPAGLAFDHLLAEARKGDNADPMLLEYFLKESKFEADAIHTARRRELLVALHTYSNAGSDILITQGCFANTSNEELVILVSYQNFKDFMHLYEKMQNRNNTLVADPLFNTKYGDTNHTLLHLAAMQRDYVTINWICARAPWLTFVKNGDGHTPDAIRSRASQQDTARGKGALSEPAKKAISWLKMPVQKMREEFSGNTSILKAINIAAKPEANAFPDSPPDEPIQGATAPPPGDYTTPDEPPPCYVPNLPLPGPETPPPPAQAACNPGVMTAIVPRAPGMLVTSSYQPAGASSDTNKTQQTNTNSGTKPLLKREKAFLLTARKRLEEDLAAVDAELDRVNALLDEHSAPPSPS